MLKKENGRIGKFIIEFIIIFLILAFIMAGVVFVGAYFLGLDIKIENTVDNEIEVKVYKKASRRKANSEETKDTYILNDLSLDDENLNQSIHTENDYFYNQLDEYGKRIYDKIVSNSENLKSGDYVIRFNNDFSTMLKNGGEEDLKASYKNAVDCIRYDRMDMFYIDFTKLYLKIEKTTKGQEVSYNVYIEKGDNVSNYYIDTIEDKTHLESILSSLQDRKNEIINDVYGTNYQKILQVHDYLVDNLEYDTTYNSNNNDNIIGALIEGTVVCEGYAKAFKYILDDLEIPCILVIGDAINSSGSREKHMWNYVQINDEWYAVDVTWDDPILVGGGTLSETSRYRYFCRKDDFNENHFSDGIISVNRY